MQLALNARSLTDAKLLWSGLNDLANLGFELLFNAGDYCNVTGVGNGCLFAFLDVLGLTTLFGLGLPLYVLDLHHDIIGQLIYALTDALVNDWLIWGTLI